MIIGKDHKMARIWLVKEGTNPTKGGPFQELPIEKCQALLGLEKAQFHQGPGTPGPKFGDAAKRAAPFSDPVVVVVEIEEDDSTQSDWQPGYYLLGISPIEAKRRLENDAGLAKNEPASGVDDKSTE
jgi:hypothetical protein